MDLPLSDERRGTDRWLDVLLPLLALVVTAAALSSAELSTATQQDSTPVGWQGWLLAPALAAVLLVRRRFPVLVLLVSIGLVIAYYVTGRPPIGLEIPLVAAFFSASLEGRWRVAATVAVLLAVATYGFRLSSGQTPAILGIQLTSHLLVLGGAIGAGDALRARAVERAARAERERLLVLQREDEVRQAVADARRDLALDVHDVVGHSMIVIGTQAALAAETLEEDPSVSREALGAVRETARSALAEIRQSLRALTPDGGVEGRSPAPTIEDLSTLVDSVRDTGLSVRLEVTGQPRRVPVTIDTTGYRIVQEALTNVVRHARARTATVSVAWEPDEVVLAVTDDGIGASATPAAEGTSSGTHPAGAGGGSGIRGMTHRATTVGGHLEIGPGPEGGHRVRASLPLPAQRGGWA